MNPKALLGKEIIVGSVMPPKELSIIGILTRRYYVSFSWKSGKRKGGLCVAYINDKILCKPSNLYERPFDEFITELKSRFRKRHLMEYDVIYDSSGSLQAKKIIGECQQYSDHHVQHSSCRHGGQQTKMIDKKSVLCYADLVYAEEERFVAT